jgi:RNA ligase
MNVYSRNDMAAFEHRVSQGYLRQVYSEDLVLFNYTDKCTFDRAWDQYTLVSRGIVLNRYSGEVVALPFSKFFNLGEMEEVSLKNLPLDKGYHVFEKMDGSLGIVYFHNGQWRMNTRGSFDSPQAIKGREMLNKYRTRYLDRDFTYLVEIIYPSNKIVVDYGTQEKLVLLGAVHTRSCKEVNPEVLGYVGDQLGMESAMLYPYSLDEIITLQKTLPKDQEGFVVRFMNGMRVKVKGDEYMKIAKMLSHMTPLSFWDTMKNGVVNRQYLAQLPEEFRKDFEPMVRDLEGLYHQIMQEVLLEYLALPLRDLSVPDARRTVGLFMNSNTHMTHKSAMWPMLDQKYDVVDQYIMKRVRPTNNLMRSAE